MIEEKGNIQLKQGFGPNIQCNGLWRRNDVIFS
jgi:hypothetical protein